MIRTDASRTRTVLATWALALALLFVAVPGNASPGGYTGRTATTSGGCASCHTTLSGTTTVVLSGPTTLVPGATGSYLCVVSHDPAYSGTSHAGVDIGVKTAPNGSVDAGTLAASGSDLHGGVSPSTAELTHSSAKTMSGSPATATFAFTWTAPATAGSYTMQALGLATNGARPGVWGWAAPLTIVVTSAGESADLLVPVVLDVNGEGGARYTTELTLSNVGTSAAAAKLTYVASASSSSGASGFVSRSVGAGQQLVIADVVAALADGGIAVARPGEVGSLRVSWTGLSSAEAGFASARTTTAYGTGRTGLAYPALRPAALASTSALVLGLKESTSDRSNLALVNGGTSGTITLGIALHDAATGVKAADLAPVTLKPGEWTQMSRVLQGTGVSNGWVRVTRLSGSEPFAVYGVVNDAGTNDGAYLEMSLPK